jgi:hypothetical protein
MMNWKGFGRILYDIIVRYRPDILMEGLRKTTKKLSQDSRSSGGSPNIMQDRGSIAGRGKKFFL